MMDVTHENLERIKQWLRDHDEDDPNFSYYQVARVTLERALSINTGRDENEQGAALPSWERRLALCIDALVDVRPLLQGDGPRAVFGAGIDLLRRATGGGKWQDRVQEMIDQLSEISEHSQLLGTAAPLVEAAKTLLVHAVVAHLLTEEQVREMLGEFDLKVG